ncbi:MAG: DNA-binding response regulator [Hydrocarboniphaga sp.]|uniref:response regulator n=1 Tax=Hydrocarboniphaga sp. TaxID=2033016 RepID=UPI002621C9F3|nr:response regulator transcription factor [Hydrocarboniphaga sp.]MDB5972953.1 DNA-binding response regulator [Hydrocarboniphaga sp.]
MSSRIAVVDDDPLLRQLVVDYLSTQGYAAQAYEGGAALRAAFAAQTPHCVILDLIMPGEDGLTVLRWLRSCSDVPVIMLTSNDATADRVVGLELGADDYVAKPADLRELLARIRSVLRRRGDAAVATPAPVMLVSAALQSSNSGERWFGRWRLDRSRRRLVDPAGEVLPITGAEFGLLCVFADHPNVILSRDKLLELSGTDPGEVFDRAIDLRITRLRRKIEPVPGDPTVIRTVRGHGGGYEYLHADRPNYGR